MQRPTTFPGGRAPGHPRRAVLAFLLLAAALAGVERTSAEPLRPDPVENFRRTLKQEQRLRNEQREALRFRKQALDQAAQDIQTLGDLSRALLLLEWQTD